MFMNFTNMTNPTAFTDVQNATNPRRVATYQVRIYTYRMPVPPGLEYAPINNDAPATSIPYAGSPGAVRIFGNGFSNTTNYFDVDVEAVWMLRGRQ